MGKTIKFNTGRKYSEEGQIIKAEEFGVLEYFDFDCEQYVIFEDITRGIKGKIEVCELSETAIMRSYDNGGYINI